MKFFSWGPPLFQKKGGGGGWGGGFFFLEFFRESPTERLEKVGAWKVKTFCWGNHQKKRGAKEFSRETSKFLAFEVRGPPKNPPVRKIMDIRNFPQVWLYWERPPSWPKKKGQPPLICGSKKRGLGGKLVVFFFLGSKKKKKKKTKKPNRVFPNGGTEQPKKTKPGCWARTLIFSSKSPFNKGGFKKKKKNKLSKFFFQQKWGKTPQGFHQGPLSKPIFEPFKAPGQHNSFILGHFRMENKKKKKTNPGGHLAFPPNFPKANFGGRTEKICTSKKNKNFQNSPLCFTKTAARHTLDWPVSKVFCWGLGHKSIFLAGGHFLFKRGPTTQNL